MYTNVKNILSTSHNHLISILVLFIMIITEKNEAQEETHIEQIVQLYFPHLSTSQLCLFFSSSWFPLSLRSKLKDIIDKGNNLYYYTIIHTYYIFILLFLYSCYITKQTTPLLVGKNVGTLQLVSIPTPLYNLLSHASHEHTFFPSTPIPDLHHCTFLSFSLWNLYSLTSEARKTTMYPRSQIQLFSKFKEKSVPKNVRRLSQDYSFLPHIVSFSFFLHPRFIPKKSEKRKKVHLSFNYASLRYSHSSSVFYSYYVVYDGKWSLSLFWYASHALFPFKCHTL